MKNLLERNPWMFLACLFFFMAGVSGCNTIHRKTSPEFKNTDGTAFFDNFTYKGDDDFYKKNPLPGDDYFYNPVLPGWYSDPSLCTDGKDYFMVTSTFSYFPGVPLFHSTDLMNWKQIGNILNRTEQLPLDGQRTTRGIFAPAISYNPHNQTWYLITTNVEVGNFFVKTKDPFGSWSDPIWLPDVHGIDPSFFFDDDGKAYIVNNDEPDGGSTYEGHRAIRIHQFDVEKDSTIGSSVMLVNGGVNLSEKPIWIEGPHLYKMHGYYYLMCAEGGTSIDHREVIFRSNSPMGTFKPWEKNPILTQKNLDPNRPLPITCAGHADLIQKTNGEWWAAFLACRPIDNKFENLGRETFMMPVCWSNDNFPYMTRGNELVPRIVQMKGVKRDTSIATGNFEQIENFDRNKLGLDWMTLRAPALDKYSLTDNPGYLSLRCANVASNELKVPSFICRRLQHHKFECTTTMYFIPETQNQQAGMLLYKDEKHQYLLALTLNGAEEQELVLRKVGADGVQDLASCVIKPDKKSLRLKIDSDGNTFGFYYALADRPWQKLIDKVDASFLSTASAGGFTGTVVGLYASGKQFNK